MCVGCICVNLLKLQSKYFSKLHLLSTQTDIIRYMHCKFSNVLRQDGQNAGASGYFCQHRHLATWKPLGWVRLKLCPREGASCSRWLEKQEIYGCYSSPVHHPGLWLSSIRILIAPADFAPTVYLILTVFKGCGKCATVYFCVWGYQLLKSF